MKFEANLNLKGHQFFLTHPVYHLKSSISAGRSDLNVLIPYGAPFCVILTEQIQFICNVSIKNLGVAENYAFLRSLESQNDQIRTFDNGAWLQRAAFLWDTLYIMKKILKNITKMRNVTRALQLR